MLWHLSEKKVYILEEVLSEFVERKEILFIWGRQKKKHKKLFWRWMLKVV